MRDHRFEGWLAGAGISYGYRWNFGRDKATSRWGMEATIGVGYAYMDYEKFPCRQCDEKIGDETKHYFGPTKIGLSLIYSIGKKKQPAPAPVPEYNPLVVVRTEPEAVVSQPEPQPEPAPVVVSQPTTGERLAESLPFVASADDYRLYLNDKDGYIDNNREGALIDDGDGIVAAPEVSSVIPFATGGYE